MIGSVPATTHYTERITLNPTGTDAVRAMGTRARSGAQLVRSEVVLKSVEDGVDKTNGESSDGQAAVRVAGRDCWAPKGVAKRVRNETVQSRVPVALGPAVCQRAIVRWTNRVQRIVYLHPQAKA